MKTYRGSPVLGDRLRRTEYVCARCGLVGKFHTGRKPTACADCQGYARRDARARGEVVR